jgi:hypothetical protein
MAAIDDMVKRQRAAANRTDAATMTRLVDAYRLRFQKMRRDGDALVAYIAAHPDMTPAQIKRTARYKELVAEYESDLSDYAGYLKSEIEVTTRAGLTVGERDALALIALTAGVAGRPANIASLSPDVVQTMMRFMSPDSALYQRVKQLAPYHAENIASALVDAVTKGINPKVTATKEIAPLLDIAYQELTKAAGQALTDALRMARTSQLWAYRESTRATYIVNQDIVIGWYWSAELDESTCMSCIAQHGTFHLNSEQLDDHYNGRCAMVPAVAGQPSPIEETGAEWFASQPEAMQSKMMGPEYYAAYQGGAFDLAELSRVTDEEVYGHMRTVTPLYELLGAEPPARKND